MQITVNLSTINQSVTINTNEYINLSQIIRRKTADMPNAYYINPPQFQAIEAGSFIGDTARGGACNCEYITFNAHGNGTHTECVGHISKEKHYITAVKMPHFLSCHLANVTPISVNNDYIITLESYDWQSLNNVDAVIINSGLTQKNQQFSGSNPCYISDKVAALLHQKGIKHLLTDLPSVDREEDEGQLLAHKAFFNYPSAIDLEKTITELVYAPQPIDNGNYIIQIKYTAFETDAVPSEVYLYPNTKY